MNRFLDYIEKFKFAIVGTVVFHVAFFISANFTTISNAKPLAQEDLGVEMPLDEIVFDEEMMEMLEMEDPNIANEKIYNLSSDKNDERERSFEDYSSAEIDDQVIQDVRETEREYQEYWKNQRGDNGSTSSQNDGADKEDLNQDKNNPVNQNNEKQGSNSFAGSVLAEYDLKDRKALSLPKPGYTCDRSGTVVVEIKVDQNGKLKSATFLPERSKNADECMIEQAVKYAKRARFDYNAKAPNIQTGTITFKFVGG